MEQSFSRTGRPHDNALAESFFASMKREELYRRNYHSVAEFRQAVDAFITFYNTKRPHRTLVLRVKSTKQRGKPNIVTGLEPAALPCFSTARPCGGWPHSLPASPEPRDMPPGGRWSCVHMQKAAGANSPRCFLVRVSL